VIKGNFHSLVGTESTRPTTALQARAQQLLIDLVEAEGDKDRLKTALAEFRKLFEQSKKLVDFPARDLIDLLMELGEELPLDNTFDEIFEVVLALAQERDSSATAGRMLLRRGTQKVDSGQSYEAIRLLGRAQQRLALRECRAELVTALALCAQAYEGAGLLWAARASMLFAASQALREFWEEGTFTRQAYACLRRLIWLDIQLCRVPCALAWVETAARFSHTIKLDREEEESLHDEWNHLDLTLGLLLLKTEFRDLKYVTRLAGVLERLNLDFSWIALLYALGYEDRLRADKLFPESDSPEDVLAVFTDAVDKVETSDLSQTPQFLDKRKIELRSSVLGCAITVELANQNRSLFLAEAILAALEAFLATSLNAEILPYTANFRVKIIPCDFATRPFEWTILEDQQLIEVRHSTDEAVDVHASQDLLAELVITITTQIAIPTDLARFEALFRDEQAMGRAISFSNIALTVHNILGATLKLRITDWTPGNAEEFPLRRTEAWNSRQLSLPKQTQKTPPVFGAGDPPVLGTLERIKGRRKQLASQEPLISHAGSQMKVGRNDSCPCGSGKKFKKCHGR